MLERLSAHVFAYSHSHLIRYNTRSQHLRCSCNQFKFESKCSFADEAREILQNEGLVVHYPRPITPIFIQEITPFQARIKEVVIAHAKFIRNTQI